MTLTTTLKWIYGPASCYRLPSDRTLHPKQLAEQLSQQQIQQSDLVYGHALFGLHRHLDCSCRYFTMLRDPVRRVASHYFYHKERYPNSPLSSNRAGLPSNGDSLLLRSTKPLRNDFAAFGLTERFDESLFLFRNRLDWRSLPFYVRRKVNSKRPAVEELPADTVEAVQQQNLLDTDLYRFAKKHFERTINAEFSGLNPTLSRFRRWNRLAQSVAPPLLWLYRTGRSLLPGLRTPEH
ncbi:MAG: hypothetical protein BRD51_05010 [Bacteroidetes bacterium SW_11_64_17]|nr:MAG: hypothetical protein BRD51_05010 [Bacteroidetes bacterium SW_11_64_17]